MARLRTRLGAARRFERRLWQMVAAPPGKKNTTRVVSFFDARECSRTDFRGHVKARETEVGVPLMSM